MNKSAPQTEPVEDSQSCGLDGQSCPPSHRIARRVSLGIIAVLVVLILVAGVFCLVSMRG